MEIKLVFNCEPMAIQSMKVANRGKFVQKYQPTKNVEWKNFLKFQALDQISKNYIPTENAIYITKLHYIFSPLKSFSKKKMKLIEEGFGEKMFPKITKPDITDNLNKGLFDALEGIIYRNDSQVVGLDNVRKYYGLKGKIELSLEIKE